MAIGEGLRVDLGRAPLLKPGGLDLNAMKQTPWGPTLLAGVKSAIDSFNDSVNNSQQWSNLLRGVNPVVSDAAKAQAQQTVDTASLATKEANVRAQAAVDTVPGNATLLKGRTNTAISQLPQEAEASSAKLLADKSASNLSNQESLSKSGLIVPYNNNFDESQLDDNNIIGTYTDFQAKNPTLNLLPPDQISTIDMKTALQNVRNKPIQNQINQAKLGSAITQEQMKAFQPNQGNGEDSGVRYNFIPGTNGKQGTWQPYRLTKTTVVGNDGKSHVVLINPYTGKQEVDSGVSGAQGMQDQRFTQSNAQKAAAAGITLPAGSDDMLVLLSNANQVKFNPDQVGLPKEVAAVAQKKASELSEQTDVQQILKASPNIDHAIQNFQSSYDAKTGVMSQEALQEAARAFRGAAGTKQELESLIKTAGLPDRVGNLVIDIWYGDHIAAAQKDDYIAGLQALKSGNDQYIQEKYAEYANGLDFRARPYAPNFFSSIGQFMPKQGTQGGANFPKPPAEAINNLRKNPSSANFFDETFGPGSSAQYLDKSGIPHG